MIAVFDRRARMQRMLDFEAALARALVHASLISSAMGETIASQCDASLFDVDRITTDAVTAGNPAIPLIDHLRARVAARDVGAATYVHWGATSQDAVDTGLVLQLRDAFALFDGQLEQLTHAVAAVAAADAATLMVGRTWMQHATPTTLGFKAATWLDALHRHRRRFASLRENALVLQFGGAVGTLSALGTHAPAVAAALAAELELAEPAIPWHTTRDRVAEVATTLGLLTGTLGKMARDVSLLAQTEVAEVSEGAGAPGRGRSSTMPHKHNPVGCAAVLAAAVRMPGLVATMLAAMVQEHERALGGWQAEWDTLPELCIVSFGALTQASALVSALEIDRARMAANLEVTRGAIFAEAVTVALAPRVGRAEAIGLVQAALDQAGHQGRHLRDVLADVGLVREHLSGADLEKLFDARERIANAAHVAEAMAVAADHAAGTVDRKSKRR